MKKISIKHFPRQNQEILIIIHQVKSARRRNNADIYGAALHYIKMILVWFLLTNIPLAICGFILLLYAFFPQQQTRDQWFIQPVYVACMAITAFNIILNPIFFIQVSRVATEGSEEPFSSDTSKIFRYGSWPQMMNEKWDW